jgi:IMP dehydrogenase
MIDNGSIPLFHRWLSLAEKKELFNRFPEAFFSVGINEGMDLFKLINSVGLRKLVIDIAHGHDERVLRAIDYIKKSDDSFEIIAGNVCTEDGYRDLVNAGADAVKVGIGPGMACTTRNVTGVGVPQFSAIQDCYEAAKKLKIPIIADGGILGSRHINLALAAGAACVMVGYLFANSDEGAATKVYRGQASAEFQEEKTGGLKKDTVAEGISLPLDVRINPAQKIIDNLLGGIRSGMTYMGARNIAELQRKADFREVKSSYYA